MILAGTGHRPNKLGGYDPTSRARLIDVATFAIKKLKPEIIISGMALGWDQALVYAALATNTTWHAYIPFTGQEGNWPSESQARYHSLLRTTKTIIVCSSGGYAVWKMQHRNKCMVDACDRLLALWDGSSGGTANCIQYAESVGKPITNCYTTWSKS